MHALVSACLQAYYSLPYVASWPKSFEKGETAMKSSLTPILLLCIGIVTWSLPARAQVFLDQREMPGLHNLEPVHSFSGSILHNVDIPEIPDILRKRKEQEERQKARQKELNELAANYKKNKEQGTLGNGGKVVPFKRDSPKVGRNEPCPCGSGLKFKKCCLNKTTSL
jgi:hypothetical protein